MGNFNAAGLEIKRFSDVNIGRIWDKHCKSDEISQSEFMNFIYTLSSKLNLKPDSLSIAQIFNTLQKSGSVNFQKFSSEFDQWTNQKIQELEGVEVLQPTVPLTLVTKYYQLTLPSGSQTYKRFPLINPSENEKSLKITSNNTKIIKIRTPYLKILPQEVEYIKLKIIASQNSQVLVLITHASTEMIEEAISFKIIIEDLPVKPVSPEIVHPKIV